MQFDVALGRSAFPLRRCATTYLGASCGEEEERLANPPACCTSVAVASGDSLRCVARTVCACADGLHRREHKKHACANSRRAWMVLDERSCETEADNHQQQRQVFDTARPLASSNTNVRCEPKRSTTDRRAYCLLYAAMSYSRGGCRFRSISRPVGVGGRTAASYTHRATLQTHGHPIVLVLWVRSDPT